MEVILREDVPALGKAGEVVRVSEGYGRNFLLPQKRAVVASPAALKQLESEKEAIRVKREKTKTEAEALAQKVAELTLTLFKQAGEEDKIFGSVSTREIAVLLQSQGITVDKKLIRMKEPIRTVGEHTVEVHLHGDVVVPLKVIVLKK